MSFRTIAAKTWTTVWTGLFALALLAEMTSWAWSADGSREKVPHRASWSSCAPSVQRQGVKLEIDGAATPVPETGPWQISCRPGPHRISAKRPGCFPIEQTIDSLRRSKPYRRLDVAAPSRRYRPSTDSWQPRISQPKPPAQLRGGNSARKTCLRPIGWPTEPERRPVLVLHSPRCRRVGDQPCQPSR